MVKRCKMHVGIQLVINDVDGNHSLKVGHPDNEQEKQMMYHYRYLVYRKNGLIQSNANELDVDEYD